MTVRLADPFYLVSVRDCVIRGPGHPQNLNRPAGCKGSTGFHFFYFLWSFGFHYPPHKGPAENFFDTLLTR